MIRALSAASKAMDFHLHCQCGKDLVVTEGSAGAKVRCDCGRSVDVPGLKELRTLAGLPAYDLSPELVIEQLQTRGELPQEQDCVECGVPTDGMVRVVIECERAWNRGTGVSGWLALLMGILGLMVVAVAWAVSRMSWNQHEEQLGRDKFYTVPIRLCPFCAETLTSSAKIKECLRNVPLYRRLLDKFPDATVSSTNTSGR